MLIICLFCTGATLLLPFKVLAWALRPAPMRSFSSILVTGASSGIGAELARQYAAPGVRLVLVARRVGRLAEVKAECEAWGADVVAVAADVCDAAAMAAVVSQADDAKPLDLVIANAGVHASMLGDTVARWQDDGAAQHKPSACREMAALCATMAPLTEVNVNGVSNTIVPILPRMQARKRGQLVLVSSVASICPLTDPEWIAYHASKSWVRSLGMGLRGLLQPYGVGVTVLCPGLVASEMEASVLSGVPLPTWLPMMTLPTNRAVRKMIDAIGSNVGVHVMREHAGEYLGTSFLGFNVLPPFAFNGMMAGFRMAPGKW